MFSYALWTLLVFTAAAKINVPHPKTIQIESLVPFDAQEGISSDPSSFKAAIVVDGVSQANHLDMNCNNKFCQMMKYAVVRCSGRECVRPNHANRVSFLLLSFLRSHAKPLAWVSKRFALYVIVPNI
jgi:hypothetical protein